MSAIGPWNNRYEGGPCYAACMETFTLYSSTYLATILQLLSAGKVVTMEQVESTMRMEETRLRGCVKDLQLRR